MTYTLTLIRKMGGFALPPLDNYRLHTRKEEDSKNSVPLASVIKGVLLQQLVQAVVAHNLFLFTKESGNVVEECKLRVIYAPPTPSTSGTGQRTEEVVSSNGLGGSRTFVDSPDKSSELLFEGNFTKSLQLFQASGDNTLLKIRSSFNFLRFCL